MDIKTLEYFPENYPLKLMGVMVEGQDGEPILSEYFHGFTTFLRKICEEDDTYTYYVNFEIGYVLLLYFYKKEKSIYDLFMLNKNYCIVRIKHGTDIVERTHLLNKEDKEQFALVYGPLKDTYYDEKTYTEYADEQCEILVPKK